MAAARTCGESAPPPEPAAVAAEEETTAAEATQWLQEQGLLPEGQLGEDEVLRRFKAFSKCTFGEGVTKEAQ